MRREEIMQVMYKRRALQPLQAPVLALLLQVALPLLAMMKVVLRQLEWRASKEANRERMQRWPLWELAVHAWTAFSAAGAGMPLPSPPAAAAAAATA